MLRYAALLFLILFSANFCKAQDIYGLEFASKNISQEDRTSLELFPNKPLSVKDQYSLSFDLSFLPFYQSNFGYIVRIFGEEEENIDLIYNMHKKAFDVVTGNTFSGISFQIPKDTLYYKWNNIILDFNINQHALSIKVNKQLIGRIISPVIKGKEFTICFGATYRKKCKTFDLPTMRIKDVQIRKQGVLKYHWPLNETAGTSAYDQVARQTATIKNPVWMKKESNVWKLEDSMVVNNYSTVTMDPVTENIIITSPDSIYNFIPSKKRTFAQAIQAIQPIPAGTRAIYDPLHKQLLHVFQDQHKTSTYDTVAQTWTNSFEKDLVTTYWHSSIFYSPFDSSVYTVGGYGDFNYKNEIHRFDPNTQQWDKIKPTGDFFTPRYLSAAGLNKTGDSVYILGGYGSLTGDQLLNPHPLYDLSVLDLKTKSFKTIYQLAIPDESFVCANNLIVNSDKGEYYALTFPNDRMRSSLQLIKGSLKDPSYTSVAASIPYRFYDIQSSAYLFYCPKNDKLIAVTMFTADNKKTIVKVYTLLFSPYGLAVPTVHQLIPVYVIRLLWGIGIGFALFLILTLISYIYKKRSALIPAPAAEEFKSEIPAVDIRIPDIVSTDTVIKPAVNLSDTSINIRIPDIIPVNISLFGPFTVYDKENNDISKSFTPLLKELFLLLYLHTEMGKGGITSEKINDLLWPGRAAKDAKNNRSVNFVKLKNILDKTGNYNLIKENDRWFLHLEDIHTDLKDYLQLTADNNDPVAIASILNKGGFLPEIEYPWLDKFKAIISSGSINVLLPQLDNSSPEEAIHLCDAVLQSDGLCEEAIYHKCKALIAMRQHASAKKIYTDFTKSYEQLYGETYEKPYSEIIEQATAIP